MSSKSDVKSGAGSSPVETSTSQVAQEQATAVAGSASDAAQRVTGVAREQAGQVAAEAGQQVKHLAGQARSQLTDQAQAQQQRAAAGLHVVADQLAAMAAGSGRPGVAADIAGQAADKVQQAAAWLGRDPAALLADVRSLGRRRPGTFLAVALGAGVLAGRLARGAAAGATPSGSTSGQRLVAGQSAAALPAAPAEPSADDSPQQVPTGAGLSASPPHAPATLSSGESEHPAPDLPDELDGELYGTGLVPDWTGKSRSELDSQ